MTPEQRELLLKASQSISAAKLLNEQGFPDFAASRAYYAMFYVAQAMLMGEGMTFSKHSATIAAFGRHFAQTGKAVSEFHRILIDAQDLRQAGDYGAPHMVTPEQALEQIHHAERFIELAQQVFGP